LLSFARNIGPGRQRRRCGEHRAFARRRQLTASVPQHLLPLRARISATLVKKNNASVTRF